MSSSFIVETIRKQWLFLLLFLGASVAAVIGAFLSEDEEETGTVVVSRPPANPAEAQVPSGPFKPKRIDPKAEAEQHIERYLQAVSDDPAGKDVPLYLRRIGNLYLSQMNDPQKAVEFYEDLLLRFPKWDGNDKVYLNVASCYIKLRDPLKERQTYEKMLKYFDEGSAGHDYALEKLGRK